MNTLLKINNVIGDIERTLRSTTTGNVAHKVGTARQGLVCLKELIKDLDLKVVNDDN